MARNSAPVNVVKESLFMRVIVDGEPAFLDVTSHVGKQSPYKTKVRTTVGYRVSKETVAFSVMQVTKNSAKRILSEDAPLKIPRGTLTHLEEKAKALTGDESFTGEDVLLVMGDEEYRFKFRIDDTGILSLEPEFEDDAFELPARPLRFTLYFRSPKADRIISVGFSGFIDRKPGDSETVTRVALKAIANATGLANFRILTGIETVDMPAPPVGAPVMPMRRAEDHVTFDIPLRLFDEEGAEFVGEGTVSVEVDLDRANASTGQLLYHVTPDEELEPVLEVYRTTLMQAIGTVMKSLLPEAEQRDLTYDIVLGQVGAGDIQRLKDITAQFPALDLTPTQYRENK